MNSHTYGANIKSIIINVVFSIIWIALTIFLVLFLLIDLEEMIALAVFPIFTLLLAIIYLRKLIGSLMIQFHVSDREVVVQRTGRNPLSYKFEECRIMAEDVGGSVGAAFGLLGMLLTGSKRCLIVTDNTGKRRQFETYFDKETFTQFKNNIKNNSVQVQQEKDQVAVASGVLDQQRVFQFSASDFARAMAASITLWVFTAIFGVMIYMLAYSSNGEDMFFFLFMLALFVIPSILLTLINLCFLKRVSKRVVLNSRSFQINKREFMLGQVKDLKVTPLTQPILVKKIKFKYNGKKYCFTMGKLSSDSMGKTTAEYYEDLLRYFRVKFKETPEVLKRGFE